MVIPRDLASGRVVLYGRWVVWSSAESYKESSVSTTTYKKELKMKGLKEPPGYGVCTMMCWMLYLLFLPKTWIRHCSRRWPCVDIVPSWFFSAWRIRKYLGTGSATATFAATAAMMRAITFIMVMIGVDCFFSGLRQVQVKQDESARHYAAYSHRGRQSKSTTQKY